MTYISLCHGFTNDNTKIYDTDIQKILAKQETQIHLSIGDKIDSVSRALIDKPYVLFPLGEGNADRFNQKPLYRTDVFDCETFVDTVLALANAHDLPSFQKHINEIRYQNGQPHFLTRNHFTHVDWNYFNQKKSYIQDITHLITQEKKTLFQTEVTSINKKNWYQHLKADVIYLPTESPTEQTKRLHELQKLGLQTQVNQLSKLNYIPLQSLFNEQLEARPEIFKQIPQGSIIEIARPNWAIENQIGTRLDISHLGFAIWKNGVLYFRNASSLEHRVMDIKLESYLKSYINSRSIKGIHIEKPLESD